MLTFFSDLQRHHCHPYVINQGIRAPSYDVPERADAILSAIRQAELGPIVPPNKRGDTTAGGLAPLHAVHDEDMVDFLRTAYGRHCARADHDDATPLFPSFFPPRGQRRRPASFEGQTGYYCVDHEVPITATTWHAARASAFCAWSGGQALLDGEVIVYALCRPPGHHAGPDFMGGYCYLNNAAIAARALHQAAGARGAILDIDYHHGNGTQAIFYHDPDVAYASLHVDPNTAYPYFAGYADEVGADAGEGTNWNVPLRPGTTEAAYLAALHLLLKRIRDFDPRWLVVSAGFDTYVDDPVSTFGITTAGYGAIGARIGALGKPTLVVQEGGYHVSTLGINVVTFLGALIAAQHQEDPQ